MSDVEPEAQLGALGEALARRGLLIARPFFGGLRLGLRAARDVRRQPALVALVLILASLWLLSSFAQSSIGVRRLYPDLSQDQSLVPPAERQQPSFMIRWLHRDGYGSLTQALVSRPLDEFAAPLYRTDVVAPWVSLLLALTSLEPASGGLRGGVQEVFILLTTCVGEAVGLLILVPLLGWIRDRRHPSIRDLPRYWRAHYAPLLALGLLSAIWAVFHLTVLTRGSAAGGLSEVVVRAMDLLLIVPLVFMLTPFVIVGRSAGLREGIVGGLRLLGRNWGALVALFLCFWIGHQLIAAWAAIPPWSEGPAQAGFAMGLAAILWWWASTLATALLGLWTACAFMDIARAPRESL